MALVAVLIATGVAIGVFLSRPQLLDQNAIPNHVTDLGNGKRMYDAGGCISCHKPTKGAKSTLPSGGTPLHTPVGTFYPPNITPDETTGIGKWSDLDFVNAMQRGVSPDGRHYFPAFPYTSYAHMKVTDVLDLKAYLLSLEPVDTSLNKKTDIVASLILRRGMGLWKLLSLDTSAFVANKTQTASWNRGAYLVSGAGHCNECHTPRNLVMGLDFSRRLAGGPHPEGKGKVPSLLKLQARKRFSDVDDLNSALRFGEIMGYEDMSSGGMGDVQSNMSKLPETDTKAIAEYLLSLK